MSVRLQGIRRRRVAMCGAVAAALGVGAFFWNHAERVSSAADPVPASAMAPLPSVAQLDASFKADVHPILDMYCASCHSGGAADAGLDVSSITSEATAAADARRLSQFVFKLRSGAMPPATADQPSAAERAKALAWFQNVSRVEAQKNAGDPGVVLAHRLSNAEYNYTIRDLTGVDIQPAKEFPVDAANQAGFDNTGESLNMEPELLKKYMEAARSVADHMVLKTRGIDFAPFEAVSVTDRDKYAVNAIIDFYHRQSTDLRAYFLAAWRFENRAKMGRAQATLADFGAELGLSQKYLTKVWETLHNTGEKMGPIAAVQEWWRSMPVPDGKTPDASADGCTALASFVLNLRDKTRPPFGNISMRGMQNGSQPFVLWKDRQYEATRMSYAKGSAFQLRPLDRGDGTPAERAMTPPKDDAEREQFEAAFDRFAAVFPDVYYVQARAVIYLDPNNSEAKFPDRFLSAGLHSQTGYFRDDRPLYDLILDDKQQKELDTLWRDFDVITDAPVRMYQSGIWFDRSDSSFFKDRLFDFVRTEERAITEEPLFGKTRQLSLEKARPGANDVSYKAFEDYFEIMGKTFRTMDKDRLDAEPLHLKALQDFAQRAYRRPLTSAEREDIVAFYKSMRTEGADHEDAMRDSLVGILMSPHFLYHVKEAPKGAVAEALSDNELANRLSYFLWSSIPDAELQAHVKAGDLNKPEVLTAQTRRMMQDARIAGLATEFGGNWLDFRRFEEHNGVDRERFKTFDNNLREAMFQEPIRFFTDVVQQDRSVLDFLYGDYTFVNKQLAQHYGMPTDAMADGEWVRVDNAHTFERGGLLPMAVFLTKNAPGLRTSPVKRGYWVVKRVLGEEIPAPPPNVPALPADEAHLGDLTLPQALAKHREDPSCATCHMHFDSFGLSFEGFGPIGERRTTDMGGKAVQNKAAFPNGAEGTGLTGLQTYIKASRQDDFLDNLCRKLLSNALGRTLILSDDPLVEQMVARLKANNYRFSSIVETIVTSPQFLKKRGQAALARKEG